MTNEEFLRDLKFANRACAYEISEAFEYARKLVAIVEASEDVAENPHNNFDKILVLRGKLQDLKRG